MRQFGLEYAVKDLLGEGEPSLAQKLSANKDVAQAVIEASRNEKPNPVGVAFLRDMATEDNAVRPLYRAVREARAEYLMSALALDAKPVKAPKIATPKTTTFAEAIRIAAKALQEAKALLVK